MNACNLVTVKTAYRKKRRRGNMVILRGGVLLLALFTSGGHCFADWISTNTSSESTHFTDPTTIAISGNRVKVWEMFDLRKPELYEGKVFRSIKVQAEYDCPERAIRKLYFVLHQEQMGQGIAVNGFHADAQSWRPIPPDSIAESAYRFACRKPH